MPFGLDGSKGGTFPTWTTAGRPASPVAGQTGYNSTLAILETYNGTAWVPAGGIAGLGPAFSSYIVGAQSIPFATNTKLVFDTKTFDTASCFNTSTNRFTPNVAGYYFVSIQCSLSSTSGTAVAIIYKNGSQLQNGATGTGAANIIINTVAMSLVYMNGSTDYLEAYVYSNTAASVAVDFPYRNMFTGFLARAA